MDTNPESKQDTLVSRKKPRMLLAAPADSKNKHLFHFLELLPTEELTYCTNVAIHEEYNNGDAAPFNAVAYFAAWFAARRRGLSPQLGYKRNMPWAN